MDLDRFDARIIHIESIFINFDGAIVIRGARDRFSCCKTHGDLGQRLVQNNLVSLSIWVCDGDCPVDEAAAKKVSDYKKTK